MYAHIYTYIYACMYARVCKLSTKSKFRIHFATMNRKQTFNQRTVISTAVGVS